MTLESTTLHIVSSDRPHPGSATPRELYISELQGDGSPYYGVEVRDREPEGEGEGEGEGDGDAESGWQERRGFSPGGSAAVVELRLSLPPDECTSLGSALGIEGLTPAAPRPPEDAPATHTSTHSLYVPAPTLRQPLGQRGVVLRCPLPANTSPSSLLGQVEVTLQHPGGGGAGVSGSVGSSGKAGDGGGGGGGHSEGDPASFSVSFGVPSEEEVTAAAKEEERDCDSEGDPQEPNKHRARHASKSSPPYFLVFLRVFLIRVSVC